MQQKLSGASAFEMVITSKEVGHIAPSNRKYANVDVRCAEYRIFGGESKYTARKYFVWKIRSRARQAMAGKSGANMLPSHTRACTSIIWMIVCSQQDMNVTPFQPHGSYSQVDIFPQRSILEQSRWELERTHLHMH